MRDKMSGLGIRTLNKTDSNKPIRCAGCKKLYASRGSYDDHALFCAELKETQDAKN